MFERFTDSARSVVMRGLMRANQRNDHHIGTEHLLLAACDGSIGRPVGQVLNAHGITVASVESMLTTTASTPAGAAADADALSVLGIDIDAVRDAVDGVFGRGALERARNTNQRRRFRGGRPGSGRNVGWPRRGAHDVREHIPFTPGAKACLEHSLRVSLQNKHRFIGDAHLAYALTETETGPAHNVLARAGVDLDRLRTDILACIDDGD